MARRFTFRNMIKDLGMRIGAAAVALGVFFGLGYVKSTNFLGLSGILDSQLFFLAIALLLIGLISVGWIVFQRFRV